MPSRPLSTTRLPPLCFTPVYQDYLWGGERLREEFGRSAAPTVCAESWEVSDRPEGMSIVRDGPLAGQRLDELVRRFGVDLLGTAAAGAPRFPLLVKLIDARERLSVQVHPDEACAARCGGEAKTEMWYSLAPRPGARIWAGFRPGVNADALRAGLSRGAVEPLLGSLPFGAGEAAFIPGGRVHAIGEGNLLLEVQQNSNTTWRLHDWDRRGPDGAPRPLHVEEAMRAIRWRDDAPLRCAPRRLPSAGLNPWWEVLRCAHFRVCRVDLGAEEIVFGDGRSFTILFAPRAAIGLECAGHVRELAAGTTCLVPASAREYVLRPLDRAGSALVITAG